MSANRRIKLMIPLSNDGQEVNVAVIYVPNPLTEAEWEQFHSILASMKPALVAPVVTHDTPS